MRKYYPIYLYGLAIILAGIFLVFSKNSTFNVTKITLGTLVTVGAILAFIAAFSRQRDQIHFSYHEMHALAMLIFGVSILFFCNTFEGIISITGYLFIFYFFSEIIFSIWLFNLRKAVVIKIVIVRMMLALVIGIGSVVSMNYVDFALGAFGLLFIMVGLNILLYVPVMKSGEVNPGANELSQ